MLLTATPSQYLSLHITIDNTVFRVCQLLPCALLEDWGAEEGLEEGVHESHIGGKVKEV